MEIGIQIPSQRVPPYPTPPISHRFHQIQGLTIPPAPAPYHNRPKPSTPAIISLLQSDKQSSRTGHTEIKIKWNQNNKRKKKKKQQQQQRRKKQKHDDMKEPKPDTTPEAEAEDETETETSKSYTRRHFVLVHGACHGGWVWYKVATLLSSAGHRVSAIDLAGSGVHPARIEDLHTFDEHVAPLMEAMASIPEDEKIVAVGHCFGGFALSLAMERFPKRIAAAVFATALMPKQWTSPASTLDEFFQRDHLESLMDCQLSFDQDRENPLASYTYGPKFMATIMYNCCPPEDGTLAALLARPSGLYLEDISNETMLSEENYGSVARVYIISKQDKLYTEDYQRWIIENNPPKEVKEIEGSDHMLMLSKPQELCNCLLEIAEKYV